MIDDEVLGELELLSGPGRPDFAARVIAKFLSHSRDLLAELESAAKSENNDQIRLCAHKFKGSARQVGAARLGARCEIVVRSCEGNAQRELAEQLLKLHTTYIETVRALIEHDGTVH